jgi:hypothetical protein
MFKQISKSELDKISANSVTNQFGDRMYIELQHDFSAVTLNGSRTYEQLGPNLLVGLSDGKQGNDLLLARRE